MQPVYFVSRYSSRFWLIPAVLWPTVAAQYESEWGSGDTVTGSGTTSVGNYIGWFRRHCSYFERWEYRWLWEKSFTNMCLILSGYRDKLFEYAELTPSGFCLRGWMESEVLQKKVGYTRRITFSQFEFCCPNRATWRPNKTKGTPSSLKSCKVHSVWRWDFRKLIVNYNNFVI